VLLELDVKHPDGDVPDTCVTSYRTQLLDGATGLPLPGCRPAELRAGSPRDSSAVVALCNASAIVPLAPGRPLRVVARVTAANRRGPGRGVLAVKLRISREPEPVPGGGRPGERLSVCREVEVPGAPSLDGVNLAAGATTPGQVGPRRARCKDGGSL
jgi:hypothetical protein